MKKKLTKLLSLVLALCLCLSAVPVSFAEEDSDENGEASEAVSETLQVVDIAPQKKDKLKDSETTYYKEKVDELSDGSRKSVTVEKDDKTLVYTLKDGDAEEKVLQEYEYTADDGAGLSLQTYSEIHLEETPAEPAPESDSESSRGEAVPNDAEPVYEDDAGKDADAAPEGDADAEAALTQEEDPGEEAEDNEAGVVYEGDVDSKEASEEDSKVDFDEASEVDSEVDSEVASEEDPEVDSGEASEEDPEVDSGEASEEGPEVDSGEASEEDPEVDSGEASEEDPEVDSEVASEENPEVDSEVASEEDPAAVEAAVPEGDAEAGLTREEAPGEEAEDIEDIDPEYGEVDEADPGFEEEDFTDEENESEEDGNTEDESEEDSENDESLVEEEDVSEEDGNTEDESEANEGADPEPDENEEEAPDQDDEDLGEEDDEDLGEKEDEGLDEGDEDLDEEDEDLDEEEDESEEGGNDEDESEEGSSDNAYISEEEVLVTMEELLNRILAGDEMAIAFVSSLGFGRTVDEQAQNLTLIVDEYKAHPEFIEPSVLIRDVRLFLDREITEETENGLEGYRTTVSVDSTATVEIRYDERGEAQVTRRVPTDKPTDFVITLDVSGSMDDSGIGRDNAMFSALRVVLDEILASPENTVSIIFWANNAALMQLDVDEDGITETTFSGADGYTAEMIYDHPLISEGGSVSDIVLSESYNVIGKIESLYNTWGGTEPDRGLDQAIALLEAMTRDEGRNLGVLLFTDGAANYVSSEHRTVANEQELAERFNARIVNVSIGDENAVRQYERYLDPESGSYYEPDNETLQERVLYYNIPTVSNEELAQRVTEMFDVAFQDIMSETRELTSETVTAGILAAVSARVIETVPSGFQVVTTDGRSYTVEGTDDDGNTVISFTLDNLISGDTASVSYFVVPTSADTDIGLTAYTAEAGTTLFAEPVDRIQHPEDDREVQIVYNSAAHSAKQRPDRRHPESHSNFYDYDGSDAGRISAADEKRLVNQFVQMMLNAGLNWQLIGECVDYLDETDDEKMKEMWLTMFSSLDLLDIRTLAEGSYQGQSDSQIYVNLDISNPYFMPRTIFHEVGHALDNMTGRLQADTQNQLYYTHSAERVDGIAEDVRTHVQAQAAVKVDEYIQGLQYTAWAFGDSSGLTQAQQSRDQLIGYLTDRIMYTSVPWMYEDGAMTEADLERRLISRYFGGTQPGFVNTDQLVSDIRADFKERRPDLLNCTDLPNGTDWREAYMQCISDVYGGVTNKFLDDGAFHLDGYWYDSYFGSRFDCHMAVEPWAEYTEARLMNTPNALDVVNEFLPSYRFEETEDEMYQLMMDYLDQHGIQEPEAA